MNRATITTGTSSKSEARQRERAFCAETDDLLKVAVVGDFSGRANRGQADLSQRRPHRLTKDNFETVFAQLNVRLHLPVMEQPLQLMEYEDLHPDYLYSRVPLFQQFIDLEKRLLSPAEFESAAQEIQQWKPELHRADGAAAEENGPGRMLDAILSGASDENYFKHSAEGQIDQLIKDIVAPYVQAAADCRQEGFLHAVRQASSEAMRKIMHHSDFRQLEASWRSVYLLLRRLQDHPNLQLHLIDISKQEMLEDFARQEGDLEQSQMFKCLVEREMVAGSQPFNLIVGDFFIADDEQDLHLLIDLATIAESVNSALLLGGDSKLAGCPSLAGSVDPEDWHYCSAADFAESWQAVRNYSASHFVALASPRFMLRLPYGAQSATTECFDYEELTAEHGHNYYLWANSAYLLALSICQQFTERGRLTPIASARYENFPLHVRHSPQGRWITPCAEALLTDAAALRFQNVGISTLYSVQGKDHILLPRLQSLAGAELRGPWSK